MMRAPCGGGSVSDLKASEFKSERRRAHLGGVLMEGGRSLEPPKSRYSPRNTVSSRP